MTKAERMMNRAAEVTADRRGLLDNILYVIRCSWSPVSFGRADCSAVARDASLAPASIDLGKSLRLLKGRAR